MKKASHSAAARVWGEPVPGRLRYRELPRRILAMTAACVVAAAATLAAGPLASADTTPDPVTAANPPTVAADPLPTVQVDGVVWQQVIVGNTVYVAGNFTTARPAGAAAGTNTVARNHILAYDLTTGALVRSFAPSLNAQARSIAASPDGSRIYVGGAFTTVNGTPASRIAALDPATGEVIPSFKPAPNSRVDTIVATADAVYLGGWFSAVGSTPRARLAAVDAGTGALRSWNPTAAGGDVAAMVISPDRTKLVVGGSFTTLNGSSNPGYGLAAVDAATGAVKPWAVNGLVRDGGVNSGITSLSTDGTHVYGTGYVYGSGGNLEGAFSADWADGALTWVEDCHGDSYSVAPIGEVVYAVGHSHHCGNIGGFPEQYPQIWQRAIAFSRSATGTVKRNSVGNYFNFAGNPSPSLLTWFPKLTAGSFTGQYQAAWSVTGNSDYVVLGGEFPRVNGKAQQGLVRFAVRDIAPNKTGPDVTGAGANPTLTSPAPGRVTVKWTANWDYDNEKLTYRVIRDGQIATPVHQVSQQSRFWERPVLTFEDSGLAPSSTHTYRIFAADPFGNEVRSESVSVTVAAGAAANAPPVAAFTQASSGLTASFDASTSADSDGTIASYRWDFGDGTTGAGMTASHQYTAGGTYPVKLTVTDDAGAIHTTSKAVTVEAAAPVNTPPTAAFTQTSSGLTASFDASTSTDPDGTVASYAWTFGDGTTGTGVKASKTYAAAGSYLVTLKVTDNAGEPNSVSSAVTVTAAEQPGTGLARDAFARVVTGGWGSADVGGAWGAQGSTSKYSVDGSAGVVKLAAAASSGTVRLDAVSSLTTDTRFTTALDRVPDGGGLHLTVLGRDLGGTGDYRAKLLIVGTGMSLITEKSVNGTVSRLGSASLPLTLGVTDTYNVRVRVSGTAPATVQAKVWKVGTAEPTAWQLTSTDSEPALQTAGSVAVTAYLSGSATVAPLQVRFDDFLVQ
ncbi:PKD domain-containing protein [Arthrobacter pityocampae]|uniref:PKD domain-containing protein n=1 Tax=Arthrobacter pityocampae TaxID=547334 RepID=A0A2S5IUT0_9MICC|nr:PKD domain-containing protein [Arthrobacter pityocampae]PPB48296.1 PKD domain-containing protein [Arthrobacter pityocampae]